MYNAPRHGFVFGVQLFHHCRSNLFDDTGAPMWRLNLHKSNAANERLADRLSYGRNGPWGCASGQDPLILAALATIRKKTRLAGVLHPIIDIVAIKVKPQKKKSRKFCETEKGHNKPGRRENTSPTGGNSVTKDYARVAASVSKASRHSFTRA